jgi:hypothetical protein
MYTQTSNLHLAESGKGEVLIPLIRAAATIGFAIAPCSLGFVIIAVSEHLIRSIMVGDDPEMLMSDLQNQFPNDAFEIIESDDADLVAKVVDLIERPEDARPTMREFRHIAYPKSESDRTGTNCHSDQGGILTNRQDCNL